MPNPVRQGEYVRLLAERLDVREDAIRVQFRRAARRDDSVPGGGVPGDVRPASEATARAGAERLLLHLLVVQAPIRETIRGVIEPGLFREAGHRELAEAVLEPDARAADPGRLRERLRDETAVSLLSRFLIAEPPPGDPLRTAEQCVQRIRRVDLQERVEELLGQLGDADRAKDHRRVEALQSELRDVYRELK